MKYYAERNNLLKTNTSINLKELLDYFYSCYNYFDKKDYFSYAKKGIYGYKDGNYVQIKAPSLAPCPKTYFLNNLRSKNVWPIQTCYKKYTEVILFTIIEILYDHIAIYDYDIVDKGNFSDNALYEYDYDTLLEKYRSKNKMILKENPKKEFAEQINNVLKLYKDGYYLEPNKGFIMKLPNQALKEQLSYDGSNLSESVFEKLSTASGMYYKHDSNIEMKKKAINILADILEIERNELKERFNTEYNLNKNTHEQLLFNIVNNYGIRHNNENQKENYSKEIWYDWMMQYYTSTIIVFYKLKNRIYSLADF